MEKKYWVKKISETVYAVMCGKDMLYTTTRAQARKDVKAFNRGHDDPNKWL